MNQLIKLKIIKILGINPLIIDFGDLFFKMECAGKPSNKKQFMHFPSLNEVKNQIAKVGFDLVFYAKSDAISNKSRPIITTQIKGGLGNIYPHAGTCNDDSDNF